MDSIPTFFHQLHRLSHLLDPLAFACRKMFNSGSGGSVGVVVAVFVIIRIIGGKRAVVRVFAFIGSSIFAVIVFVFFFVVFDIVTAVIVFYLFNRDIRIRIASWSR